MKTSDRFTEAVTTPDPVSVGDLAAVLHFTKEHAPTRAETCRWCLEDAELMVKVLTRRQLFEGKRAS